MNMFALARRVAAPRPPLDGWRDPVPPALTPREREVCALVAEGLDTKEIACELGLTYKTTKTYLHRAKAKLDVRNRTEIAILWHGGTPRCRRAG